MFFWKRLRFIHVQPQRKNTPKEKRAQGHARISFLSCASRHAVGRNRSPPKKKDNAGANDGDGDGDGDGDDDDDTHTHVVV
jgi:hypothetical protein